MRYSGDTLLFYSSQISIYLPFRCVCVWFMLTLIPMPVLLIDSSLQLVFLLLVAFFFLWVCSSLRFVCIRCRCCCCCYLNGLSVRFGVMQVFSPWLDKGFDVRPTIAVTKAHIDLPEVREAVRVGRLKPDGKVLSNEGQSFITKVSHLSSSSSS